MRKICERSKVMSVMKRILEETAREMSTEDIRKPEVVAEAQKKLDRIVSEITSEEIKQWKKIR